MIWLFLYAEFLHLHGTGKTCVSAHIPIAPSQLRESNSHHVNLGKWRELGLFAKKMQSRCSFADPTVGVSCCKICLSPAHFSFFLCPPTVTDVDGAFNYPAGYKYTYLFFSPKIILQKVLKGSFCSVNINGVKVPYLGNCASVSRTFGFC